MKIGILTQPLTVNYGGILQNFALQQILLRLGHEPITLDQKEITNPKWYIILSRIKRWLLYLFNPNNNKPPYLLTKRENEIICRYTTSFINKYIRHTEKCSSSNDFFIYSEKLHLECLIVGSDQCWRPCYNLYLRDMFLSFYKNKNIKRISYAASFGTDNWEFSKKDTYECSQFIKLFTAISVREDSGIELCKDFLGVTATHVLDPTMLLKKEDYINLIYENKVPASNGELFHYILDPTDTITEFIHKVCNEKGLRPFQVLPKFYNINRKRSDVKKRINDCMFPSPLMWLRAFMDAKMVIVDSFHGAVFSIIFNKPFWIIGNKKRGLSRFYSLLRTFDLEDRLLSVDTLDKVDINSYINWEKVNNILDNKRVESLNFLISALEQS